MSAAEATTVVRLRPTVAVVVAIAAIAAATGSMLLALASDNLSLPALQSGLFIWISVSYILCGLVAWHRRPESRFGPLMIAAGFGTALSNLAWANDPVVAGIGLAFDLLPLALFLHVYLAYPDGRLTGTGERAIVAAGYAIAIVALAVARFFGSFGAEDLFAVVVLPTLGEALYGAILVSVSALCLAALGILWSRRRARRPRRRAGALHRRRVHAGPGDHPGAADLGADAQPRLHLRAAADAGGDGSRAGRVPHRAARRPPRAGRGRRPVRPAPRRPRRPARGARAHAARPVAVAALLAAAVRDVVRRGGPTGEPAGRPRPGGDRHRARRGAGRGAGPRPDAGRGARAARRRVTRPPRSPWRTAACGPSCRPGWRSCAAPGPGCSRPGSASGSGSSATCTTARSSGSSRSPSTSACSSTGWAPIPTPRTRWPRPNGRSRCPSTSCATWPAACTRPC